MSMEIQLESRQLLKKMSRLTFFLSSWVHSAEVVRGGSCQSHNCLQLGILPDSLKEEQAEITYLPLLHVVFDRPRGCWRFSTLASSEKSDFALKWGTFSSSRRVASDSPSASLSQSYHRRLRLFQVERERTLRLLIPLEPLRPSCVAVGEKKNARQDVWKGRGTPPRHSVPSSFQAESAGIAESQKLGCNCSSYLERKAK